MGADTRRRAAAALGRILEEGRGGSPPGGGLHPGGERGIALLLVLVMIVFMAAYVVDFNYEARVKYLQAAQSRDQARAFYLAKSGVQIYVLLLSFGRNVASDEMARSFMTQFGLNPDDALWQSIPFIDTAILRALVVGTGGAGEGSDAAREAGPADAGAGTGEALGAEDVERSRDAGGSGMRKGFLDFDGDFKAEVSDEDRKINLNMMTDLAAQVATVQENPVGLELYGLMAPRQYDRLFTDELKMDRWELIGNLLDWTDPDTQRSAGLGGYEDSLYDRADTRFPYSTKNSKFDSLPEAQLVSGVSDKVYTLFSPSWTVHGSGKVNVNTAEAPVLWGLVRAFAAPSSTDESVTQAVQQVMTQRTLFRFANVNDFVSLLSGYVALKDDGAALKSAVSTSSKTFRLTSTGYVRDASSTVEVILTYSSGARYRIESWKEE